jgi:unsaturated chondroitin disaccharide hydrolase
MWTAAYLPISASSPDPKELSMNLKQDDAAWALAAFEKIKTKVKAEALRSGDIIPYIPRDGRYFDLGWHEGISWWTNGFWSGILWQLYNATQDELFKEKAKVQETRLDAAMTEFNELHHDVGFMWLHASVTSYKLTGDKDSLRRALHAATILAGRYNPVGRYISAWNGNKPGWMIVDCLMNIQLLFWASEETNDPRFKHIAKAHLETCLKYVARPDGSCNHIIIFDPETGALLDNPAGQGFASGSSWSRGQAWAVAGLPLSCRYTKDPAHLDAAKRVAHYFIANLAVSDWLPLVDFRAPQNPVKYDSSAAMIAACGLLELASLVPELEKPLYANSAVKILRACESKFANWDPETDGIMGNACSAYHAEGEDANASIIYADYFFIEAVLRLLGKHLEAF